MSLSLILLLVVGNNKNNNMHNINDGTTRTHSWGVLAFSTSPPPPTGTTNVHRHHHYHHRQPKWSSRSNKKKTTQLKYFDDCERFWWYDDNNNDYTIDEDDQGQSPSRQQRRRRQQQQMMTTKTTAPSIVTNMTYTQEKMVALDRLLGFTLSSSSTLSDATIEEETLRWAVDTNVVWSEDVDDDDEEEDHDALSSSSTSSTSSSSSRYKYKRIQDLLVASDCHSMVDAMVFLWTVLSNAMIDPSSLSSSSSSSSSAAADGGVADTSSSSSSSSSSTDGVQLIVFPRAAPLWNYDQSVVLLQAIDICKPLFDPIEQTVRLDLFHPQYKHSPRMWSHETHSPFPTVGIAIRNNDQLDDRHHHQQQQKPNGDQRRRMSSVKQIRDSPVMDMKATKAKLNALFQSVDATPSSIHSSNSNSVKNNNDDTVTIPKTRDQIMKDTQEWFHQKYAGTLTKVDSNKSKQEPQEQERWEVKMNSNPVHLYTTLWKSIQSLMSSSTLSSYDTSSMTDDDNDNDARTSAKRQSAVIIVTPFFDAHTLHRVAVTVNVALKKLHVPVRVSRVDHPDQYHPPDSSAFFSRRFQEQQQQQHLSEDKTITPPPTTNPPYGFIELSLTQ